MRLSTDQARALVEFVPRLNNNDHFEILAKCDSGLSQEEVARQGWEHQVDRLRDELFLIRGGRDIDLPDSINNTEVITDENFELTYFGELVLDGLCEIAPSAELMTDHNRFFERTPFWDYYFTEDVLAGEFEIKIEHQLANKGMPSTELRDLVIESEYIREVLPWNPGGGYFPRYVIENDVAADVILTSRLTTNQHFDSSFIPELTQQNGIKYYTYGKDFPFILAVAETSDGERGMVWSRGAHRNRSQGAVLKSNSAEFVSWAHNLIDAVLKDSTTSEFEQ